MIHSYATTTYDEYSLIAKQELVVVSGAGELSHSVVTRLWGSKLHYRWTKRKEQIVASFKSAFRPQVRTISPLLILTAALLLGLFVYGFTAPAALNNGTGNLAGGQGNAVGINFTLDSNSVNYGAFTGSLAVTSVSFNVTANPPAAIFSSGIRVFAKLNTDPAATYTECGASTIGGNGTNQLNVASCAVTTMNINHANFGLDVVVID